MAAALEVRAEFAAALLDGTKTVELRGYPLGPEFVGRRVYLLATRGPPGVPALGDSFGEGAGGAATVVGWALFSGSRPYATAAALAADQSLHCVPSDSPYGWIDGRERHGWVVRETGRLTPPTPPPPGARVHRSLYRLARDPERREGQRDEGAGGGGGTR